MHMRTEREVLIYAHALTKKEVFWAQDLELSKEGSVLQNNTLTSKVEAIGILLTVSKGR